MRRMPMTESSPPARTCPRCSAAIPADAPLGLCPKCLVGSGFGFGRGLGDSGTGDRTKGADLGTVGRYRLLELIGEGGFGEVYRAEQTAPVRRVVALKIIKRGMDTRQVIARFEGERQALAILDHPNVAQVYDAGETSEGRPYFVMELVAGDSITEFCARHELNVRGRLDLFRQALAGVAHAHQRGIIHRDLKPSNILVRPDSAAPGGGVPVIIDFGVAKATQHILTEKTVFTEACQFIGTPEYVSPEQAVTGGQDVDTRSDVYSLGVILYELLTTTTPYGRGSATNWRRGSGSSSGIHIRPEAVLRDVRETDPPTPSSRLKAMEGRGSGPTRAREVRGDLDWVVMRAMEKDRARRYGSVREFADDVSRFLAGEPVRARSPSRIYLLRKFVRRHRAAVAAGGLVLLALLVATPVSLTMAWRARRAEEAERRTFSRSDLQIAGEFAAHDNPSLAAAHLARALRTDPDNQAAAFKLLCLLAYENFAVPAAAPLVHSEFVRTAAWSSSGTILTACDDGSLRLWEAASGRLVRRLDGHRERVESIAVSPDGRTFATGSWDGTARVWDGSSGEAVTPWFRHADGFAVLAYHPDGRHLAATTLDGEVLLWSLADGRMLWRHRAASHFVLAFSPDGSALAVAGPGASVVVWELDGQREVVRRVTSPAIPGADYVTRSVWLSEGTSAGGRLAIVTAEGFVRVWDTDEKGFEGNSMRHFRTAWALAASPDLSRFASGSHDGTARLWHSAAASPISRELAHDDPIYHVAFSGDGSRLVTIGNATRPGNPAARVWDGNDGAPVTAPIYHPRGAFAFALDPNGRMLATGSRDRTLRLWDIRVRAALPIRFHFGDAVWWTRFSAGGRGLACWGMDGTLHLPATSGSETEAGEADRADRGEGLIWGLRAGRIWTWQESLERFLSPEFRAGGVLSAAYSRDAETLATGCQDGLVRLWNRAMRTSTGMTLQHPAAVTAVAFGSDGGWLLSGCRDGSVHAWNLATAERTASVQAHRDAVRCLAVADELAVTGSEDRTARLWRWTTGALTGSLAHDDPVRQVALSPDGKRVATGTSGAHARVWEVESGEPVTRVLAHDSGTGDWGVLLRFTADARRLITTGTYDNSVRVWEVATSEPACPPMLHDAPVGAVDLHPSGHLLATGSDDRTVRLWHLESGELLSPPFGHTHEVMSVAFDAEGRRLISGSLDGAVMILDLPPWIERAPDWLPDAAESLAGVTLDRSGRAHPVTTTGPPSWQEAAGGDRADSPVERWGAWLFADVDRRSISPWSDLTRAGHVRELVASERSVDLRQALRLAPHDARVMALLGQALSREAMAGGDRGVLSEARFLVEAAIAADAADAVVRRAAIRTKARCGEAAEALRRCAEELGASPDDPAWWRTWAELLRERGFRYGAYAAFRLGELLAASAGDTALEAACNGAWAAIEEGLTPEELGLLALGTSDLSAEQIVELERLPPESLLSRLAEEPAHPLLWECTGRRVLERTATHTDAREAEVQAALTIFAALRLSEECLRQSAVDLHDPLQNGIRFEIEGASRPESRLRFDFRFLLASDRGVSRMARADAVAAARTLGLAAEPAAVLGAMLAGTEGEYERAKQALAALVAGTSGRSDARLTALSAAAHGLCGELARSSAQLDEAIHLADRAGERNLADVLAGARWQMKQQPDDFARFKAIPPRPPNATADHIDLGPHFNAALGESWLRRSRGVAESLQRVPAGLMTVEGIGFDVRGVVQLGDGGAVPAERARYPSAVRIPLGAGNRTVERLHVLAATGRPQAGEVEVARCVLHFADGTRAVRPLRYAVDLGCWIIREEVLGSWPQTGLRAPAWIGPLPDAARSDERAVLYHVIVENPAPARPIAAVEIGATTAGAAFFLVGLTIE